MGRPISAHGYSWRHADRDTAAVGPLDFDIAAGEKVLLLGPSGAGKSTLLHAIAGVLPVEAGEATGELLVDGQPPDPRRGVTGLVLQDPDSQVIFSRVGDDVAFGVENLGLPAEAIDARIASSLDAMGLDLPLDHPTAALSGGQKQRLALAGIHAMAPEVIVLDEPTANIDPASASSVRDAVLTVQAATAATMIVVEHRVGLWCEHVDTVIVLGRGGVVASGTPEQVFGNPDLAEVLRATGIWVPESGSRTPPPAARLRPSERLGGPVLVADHLSVARPRASMAAARDLELSVRPGEALGIVGPNGAGKSTTALTLAGLLPEFAGEVRAVGSLAVGARHPRPFRWPSAFLAPRIGMVFQEPEHQFLRASVAEELALGPRLAGWSSDAVDERVSALLETLGLTAIADAHPQGLSGGEKRRLSVAAMLAPRPQVLVVDEPTFGQDALTWAGLVELFLDVLDRGSSVIAVSHDLDFLRAIGARRVDLGSTQHRASLPDPLEELIALSETTVPAGERVAVQDPGQFIPVIRHTALVRCNPLTKIAVALILMVGALLSIDIVSAGVVLGFCLLALPATGLDLVAALKRLWFLPLGALLAAWGTAILAEKTGSVVVDVGPILMTSGSLESAAAIFVRALALAVPLVVLASTIDPRDLSDALVQHLRLPETVVVSVLAASRLLGLLVSEWQTLTMARRARGLAGGTLLRRTGSLFGGVFVLLVQSIRRGTTLAMAMEGRAFGRPGRTWRRRSWFGVADLAIVILALAVTVAAIASAHLLGTWNPIIGG